LGGWYCLFLVLYNVLPFFAVEGGIYLFVPPLAVFFAPFLLTASGEICIILLWRLGMHYILTIIKFYRGGCRVFWVSGLALWALLPFFSCLSVSCDFCFNFVG
jgi:hypothetical protein